MLTTLRFLKFMITLVFCSVLIVKPAFSDNTLPSYEQARQQYLDKQASNTKGPGFSEADRKVMQQAADDLKQSLPDPGIKVGAKAPDFMLNNAFGKPVNLYDQLKSGPVVLVFYRGAWCPFCNMHLRTLQQSLPAFEKYHARLILVTPQKPDKSREQLEKAGQPFEVLSDLDSSVMKAYRLYFELPPDLIKVYNNLGLDIVDYNGPGRNVLPVPGTFVIDRSGIVRAMHADTDYKERMEPAAIVETLSSLDRR